MSYIEERHRPPEVRLEHLRETVAQIKANRPKDGNLMRIENTKDIDGACLGIWEKYVDCLNYAYDLLSLLDKRIQEQSLQPGTERYQKIVAALEKRRIEALAIGKEINDARSTEKVARHMSQSAGAFNDVIKNRLAVIEGTLGFAVTELNSDRQLEKYLTGELPEMLSDFRSMRIEAQAEIDDVGD